VAPQERGSGTGGRLLDRTLEEARARSGHAALEVVSLNQDAVVLYRARGWREIGSVSYDQLPEHARSLLLVPLDLGSS
jgi:GNAT superfamily N-acetyltransferase